MARQRPPQFREPSPPAPSVPGQRTAQPTPPPLCLTETRTTLRSTQDFQPSSHAVSFRVLHPPARRPPTRQHPDVKALGLVALGRGAPSSPLGLSEVEFPLLRHALPTYDPRQPLRSRPRRFPTQGLVRTSSISNSAFVSVQQEATGGGRSTRRCIIATALPRCLAHRPKYELHEYANTRAGQPFEQEAS